MENIKMKLKEVIKQEVARLQIKFPQREERETEEEYTTECMDILHDARENFDWDDIMKVKNEIAKEGYDDFIDEELWEELISLI